MKTLDKNQERLAKMLIKQEQATIEEIAYMCNCSIASVYNIKRNIK